MQASTRFDAILPGLEHALGTYCGLDIVQGLTFC